MTDLSPEIRGPGVYIDGIPLSDYEYTPGSDIESIEITGDSTLLYLNFKNVARFTIGINEARVVHYDPSPPEPHGVYFPPEATEQGEVNIRSITGAGSIVLQRMG